MKRFGKNNWSGQSSLIVPPAIYDELADRTQAICAGGIGIVQQTVQFPASTMFHLRVLSASVQLLEIVAGGRVGPAWGGQTARGRCWQPAAREHN